MAQPISRYQAAVARTAGESRLLRPEQNALDGGMDAVSADHHISPDAGAVLKPDFNTGTMLPKARKAVSRMHAIRRYGPQQRVQKIGAMGLVVRRAEGCLNRAGEWGPQ